MTTLILIAILLICLLVVLMFFILKSTVKKINSQTKLYFVDKLQEYDYMIDKKEAKLNEINQEILDKEKKGEQSDITPNRKNYEFDYQIIDLLNKTKYQDKNIFELNKMIDEKFAIDYIDLIQKFLAKVHDEGEYQFCLGLKNKFTSEEIYKLKVMDDESVDSYLKTFLSESEYFLYETYLKINKKGSIDGFLDYVNELVDLNNPCVFVYVGDKSVNYDYLGKYVKTIYSKDIYKGIKIIYKNHIYDYSLNERNV